MESQAFISQTPSVIADTFWREQRQEIIFIPG